MDEEKIIKIVEDPASSLKSALDEFLNSLISGQKIQNPDLELSKIIHKATSNTKGNSQMAKKSSVQIEDLTEDERLALLCDATVSCRHFTHHSLLNANPDYPFANNPGLPACNEPNRFEFSDKSTILTCEFSSANFRCPMFVPFFDLIKKVQTSDSNFYYLVRFRNIDSIYTYKIVDQNNNVYLNLLYSDIDIKNADLDFEAISVFDHFISDLMIEVQNIPLDDFTVEQKSEKSSYLLNLIS